MNRQVNRVQCVRHPGGVSVATVQMNRKVIASLLIDTGAAITVVVPRTAARLGLSLDRPHRMMTIGTAHTLPIPIFELDCLRIGDAEVAHLEFGVVDFPPSFAH